MSAVRLRATVLVATASLGLGLGLASAPVSAAPAPSLASETGAKRYVYDVRTGYTTDPQAAKEVKALLAKLPKDWMAKRNAFLAKRGLPHGPIQGAVESYLKGETCQPTALDGYVTRLLNGIPINRLFVLAILGVFDYPTYDAVFYGSKTNPDYALTPGTTGKVRGTMAVARGFWDIKNGDIDVMAMTSDMVVDRPRVIRIISLMFGTTSAEAAELADLLIPLIKDTTALRGGNNPIFSLNAFAFTAEGEQDPIFNGISDRIVMGEGIIKALRDTGNIEVGPQMVFSHEYGHHIQLENHAYPATTSPENTRMMELMADAYATYLDAHRKGLNFNMDRVNKAVEVAHLVGDCSTDSNGHHGTPQQRARAAAWGAALAKKNGVNVLPSKTVQALFLKALPGILAG